MVSAAELPAADAVAVPVAPETGLLGPAPAGLAALLARERTPGDAGACLVVPQPEDSAVELVLAVGVGDRSTASLRRAASTAARRARSVASLALDLRGLALSPPQLQAVAEAVLMSSYVFSRKAEPPERKLATVTLVVADPEQAAGPLQRAATIARAVAVARDLVNTPSLDKSPAWLAEAAVSLLGDLSVRVRDETDLAAEGFGGILAVGQGSTRPPRLIEAAYDGGAGPHVVLVGKGITFDSGGLSLKPNDSMQTMKTDMAGGAAVLATLRAVADLALPVRVTVLVPAAENLPSGTAQRPGDVIRHFGGRTVEVLNTDAEGRLVLADALAYADRVLAPDVVVDLATLTGAMPVALGRRTAGLFATDDRLAAQLVAAAAESGEPAWRMPLVEDYRASLDSPIADLRNIADPQHKLGAGSITAALFLREFAGARAWAHLDIAGPARAQGDEDELTQGGTGFGVRLLSCWLQALA